MPVRRQRAPGVRALVLRQAAQAGAAGLQVDHRERGEVVEERRDHRGADDLGVRHVQRLGHDERDRAHDRRHDLPAHARRRLDGAGEHRRIAEALHERDRELADGQHVGDAGARDRPHQPRRDDRDLGRAALGVADQAEREVVEELDHSGVLEERAEQDEQEDVRRRDQRRDAVDAFGPERELVDDLRVSVRPVREHARQVLAEQAVEQEQRADDRQRDAEDAPRRFEDEDDDRRADGDVDQRRLAGALDQRRLEHPLVEAEPEAHEREQPVGPRHPRHLPAVPSHRVEDEHEQHAGSRRGASA